MYLPIEYQTYFDWTATTPLSGPVAYAMSKYLEDPMQQGNPSSTHKFGQTAAKEVEKGRETVSRFFGVKPENVYFTSGGTEANNLAIKGWGHWVTMQNSKHCGVHYLVSPTAHHSMLEPTSQFSHYWASQHATCETLAIDEYGRIKIEELGFALKRANGRPVMVCVEWVNNETGVIQPIKEIIAECKRYDAWLLVDAVQAIPLLNKHMKLRTLCGRIDFISISAHKIFGPKGVGALIAPIFTSRYGNGLDPLIMGGDQEFGYRGGTQNVLGIVGMRAAFETLDCRTLGTLEKLSIQSALTRYGLELNVPIEYGTGTILNIGLKCESAYVVQRLSEAGYMVSTGAACSGAQEDSHVLHALGKPANQGLRVSLNPINSYSCIDALCKNIAAIEKEVLEVQDDH